jgi:hypothetical protein
VGAIEGAAAIAANYSWHASNSKGFAEMQIVQCDHLGEDAGCNGGIPASAFNFTKVRCQSSWPVQLYPWYGLHGKGP